MKAEIETLERNKKIKWCVIELSQEKKKFSSTMAELGQKL